MILKKNAFSAFKRHISGCLKVGTYEIKVSKVQTNNTMNGVIMLPQRAIIEHTPMPVFPERKKRVCLGVRTSSCVFCFTPFVFPGSIVLTSLSSLFYVTRELWATREAPNPNLQVVITHASHVCSQHSFGLPLRMNGMSKTQFDHARLELLPLVI